MSVQELINTLMAVEDKTARVSIDGCDCAAAAFAVFVAADAEVWIAREDTEYQHSGETRVETMIQSGGAA